MPNILKDFFYFTPAERNGFIVLLTLCIGFALYPAIYPYFYPQQHIDQHIKIETLPTAPQAYETTPSPPKALFPFDPNTASKSELIALGLSSKKAQTILNYREKGGFFSQKKDFKKIYTISEADYLRLAPYIEIAEKRNSIPKDIPQAYSPTSGATPSPKEVFSFDPNTASPAELKRLGLSDKVVQTIVKFRSKGQFYKARDFSKIFGLSKADFLRLSPYIVIEQTSQSTASKMPHSPKKDSLPTKRDYPKEKIDINLAAAEEWQLLSGIGAVLGKRIVNYRKKLGGFHTIEQVGEVYQLPDSVFQNIKPQLELNETNIRQLDINTASVDELQEHPYLKWRQAQIIVNYRENHGAFEKVEDLEKIRAFDTNLLEKIKPYLIVQ